ncbi:unnamed protein product, partial [Brassica rapa]
PSLVSSGGLDNIGADPFVLCFAGFINRFTFRWCRSCLVSCRVYVLSILHICCLVYDSE